MILTFYDKDFNALPNSASLNVGEWSLTKRVVDFDDFSATSEGFVENIEPTFVVMSDDFGRYKYGAFAGVIELGENNQTSVQATDVKSLLNNEIFIEYPIEAETIEDQIKKILRTFKEQVIEDSLNVEFDTSELNILHFETITTDFTIPLEKYGVYNVWSDLLMPYLKMYDIIILTKLDIANKKIIFKLTTNKITRNLKLADVDNEFSKKITGINQTQAIVVCEGVQTPYVSDKYYLNSANEITNDVGGLGLFPIKNKLFFEKTSDITQVADLLAKAIADCIVELAEARYNVNIKVKVDGTQFEDSDLLTDYQIYDKYNKFFKKLPVGQVVENNKGEKIIIIGYKPDDIVLYL